MAPFLFSRTEREGSGLGLHRGRRTEGGQPHGGWATGSEEEEEEEGHKRPWSSLGLRSRTRSSSKEEAPAAAPAAQMRMAPAALGSLRRVPALASLLFLLASPSSPRPLEAEGAQAPQKCVLEGVWVNDLGSRMSISRPDVKGAFGGSYLTAVSATSGNAIQASVLTGVQHPAAEAGGQPTFGFVVHWAFSDSTTVFVGQCFVGADGQETLETAWLLREKVPSHAEDWKATRVGQNTFLRVK